MILQTERLILRPWTEADAEACFQYAKDPRVGPPAGWPPHVSVENSRQVIRDILAVPETYAIVLKETGQPVGSVGLHFLSDLAQKEDEAELGYWLGVPYWGRGLIPEAAREVLRHAFEDLRLNRVWCGYYDGNERSKRVQEKLGFRYQWTSEQVPVPQLGQTRKGHVNRMTKEEWQTERQKSRVILYIHGKGGSAEEAEHYAPLFPHADVKGFNYHARTPWEAKDEFRAFVRSLRGRYGTVDLVANSLGAFFSMCAGLDEWIGRAYFISPVVDMERLIRAMMERENVSEEKLKVRGTVCTPSGTLSYAYLAYVRAHPLCWNAPTEILYGTKDGLTPFETIRSFAEAHGARLTVMDGGEHWFHTPEQMTFLDQWIRKGEAR